MKQSAGYVIIDNDTKCVLCVRAYANWGFPKGRLEDGETHQRAAIRETQEEVMLAHAIDFVDIGLTPVSVTYGKGKGQKTATYFFADRVGKVEPYLPVNPEIGKPEHDEFRWVKFDDLESLMPARLEPVVSTLLAWVKQ